MTAGFVLITGGQTGADRAALELWAARGWLYEGWVPAGGWAEDMLDPPGLLAHFPHLRAMPSADPAARTVANVALAEAVLILDPGAASPGTALTAARAADAGKPMVRVDPLGPVAPVQAWLAGRQGRLMVAGPRESEAPGLQAAARAFLERLDFTARP